MKFKKNAVVVHLIFAALLADSAVAGIKGVRKPAGSNGEVPSATSTANPENVVIKPGKPVDTRKIDLKPGTASVSCNMDQDAAKYFPLDFFQHISRDGAPLKFELRPDNQVLVKVPASIDVCGKFVPLIHQDPETRNITVMMAVDNGKTYGEYVKCLEDAKILEDGKIDHSAREGKEYSEYSHVLSYDFDKKKDVKKTVKLSYAFPKAYSGKDGYESLYGFDDKVELPSSLCMRAEKVEPQLTYVNKGQDVLIEEINEICKTKDAQKIAEARRSLGNADALKDIADKIKAELDASYLNAVKTDVAKIYEEMSKIEDKVNKNKETMDESTAKKEVTKYADLAKQLDSKFLNQAIYRLDTLLQERAKTEDPEALRKIDEEVKKINEDISAFSKRQATSFANLYSLMEKYAITDQAKVIEDIRLKSYLYGRVYAGSIDEKRGKQLTIEKANQEQGDRIVTFDRTLTDWTDQYLVGQGNLYPIKKTEKEREGAITRMNSRWASYEKKEMQDYQNYCTAGMTGGMRNPIKCKEFQNGYQSRRNNELKRRDKDLYYIKGKNAKLDKMGMNYNEYQRKIASKAERDSEMYDPYGASYTSFEDNFSDRYPAYYQGPQTSTIYDPSLYNMGGQMPFMQQQQMPFMMQGQGQMQMPMQGQFQMQQPMMLQQPQMGQMGGWPGI